MQIYLKSSNITSEPVNLPSPSGSGAQNLPSATQSGY